MNTDSLGIERDGSKTGIFKIRENKKKLHRDCREQFANKNIAKRIIRGMVVSRMHFVPTLQLKDNNNG